MDSLIVIEIFTKAMIISLKIAAPALAAIMITGLLVSLLQAATQINEQTLSFIPKIIAMTVAMAISGPWIIRVMVQFTREIIERIPAITQ